MIKTKDIKNFKHISDPTEEKLNNLKLVSQNTNKDVVSTQGESTKNILKARSLERLDTIEADSSVLDDKIGEIETSVTEELTEITDRTETVISNSKKYKQDIEAFLSVAKGDDFLFFLDDCTRAVGRLDKLTDGSYLCYGKKITSWDIPLPELTDGSDMFNECSSLMSFTGELPALTNGYYMFYDCTSLMNFTSELPTLTSGIYMFKNCIALTSFMKNLSALVNGVGMFSGCTSLISFTGDLPALTRQYFRFGETMFNGCTALTSFRGNLPALIDGYSMFNGCTSLMSFTGELPVLTYGNNMFSGCKLNLASVQNIANTINNLVTQNKTGNITIGQNAQPLWLHP